MLQLQIGSHRFKVRIIEREKPAMVEAAKRVNRMLEQERANTSVVDGERAAIIVALRCANESPGAAGSTRLDALESLLDETLADAKLQ